MKFMRVSSFTVFRIDRRHLGSMILVKLVLLAQHVANIVRERLEPYAYTAIRLSVLVGRFRLKLGETRVVDEIVV
jgi:hypothetical protein